MTRRERMERRAERRREWSDARERKSAAGFERARVIADGIPMGQPVLVGHHSERHHRADIARIDAGMRQGCESADMAKHHAAKADGIERQLETSIFSDDPDAIEALEAKAAELDAEADRAVAINKAWRQHAKITETGPNSAGLDLSCIPPLLAAWAALGVSEALASGLIANALEFSWTRRKGPMDASYDRANARRCRERIKDVRARQERSAAAETTPNGVTIDRASGCDWCRVCFADKPERAILDALRAAAFRWGAGYWSGATSKLPAAVAELAP